MTKSVLEYWKDSCQLFKKDQGKLFLLVTLNNVRKSFRAESGMVGIVAVLFMCVMLTVNAGATVALWDRAFSLFAIKSLLGVKLLGLTKQDGAGFFGALFTFSFAVTVIMRPSLERKDGRYLLYSIMRYFLFFLVAQEAILLCPFFAYLYMDLPNTPVSFIKALRGTAKLLLCHAPVVIALWAAYGVLLTVGAYIVHGAIWIGVPGAFAQAILPLAWFVLVFSLFFSACAMYYTKVKHADRQLLFGEQ